MDLYLPTAAATLRAGEKLGAALSGGEVILLYGDLGAGKTLFAKGVGRALGVREEMTSPTFTLLREYAGVAAGRPVRLVHMDLYRLRQTEEAEIIGVYDYFRADCICLVEWPELIAASVPDALKVEMKGSGDEPRQMRITHVADD